MASFQVSYTPAKNQRDKKAQWFFRDEVIQVVYRVSEKSLQRSRWDLLQRHQRLIIVILENEQAGRGSH
jgi:hypothetical protein